MVTELPGAALRSSEVLLLPRYYADLQDLALFSCFPSPATSVSTPFSLSRSSTIRVPIGTIADKSCLAASSNFLLSLRPLLWVDELVSHARKTAKMERY